MAQQTAVNPDRIGVNIAAKHYAVIEKLSANSNSTNHTTTEIVQQEQVPYVIQIILPFTPYIISAVLFVAALVIITGGKLRSARINAGTLMITLFAAAIPIVLGRMNSGLGYLTQAAPGAQPTNIIIYQSDTSSVLVHWETAKVQPGIVRYGTNLSDPDRTLFIGNIKERSTIHEVLLPNLMPGTQYELEIMSGSTWYSLNGAPINFMFFAQGPP